MGKAVAFLILAVNYLSWEWTRDGRSEGLRQGATTNDCTRTAARLRLYLFRYQSIIENQSLQNRSLRLIDGPAGTYHPRQVRIHSIRAKCIHTAHGSRLIISPIARSAQPAGARPRDTFIERLELTGRKWTKKADTNFTSAIRNRNQPGSWKFDLSSQKAMPTCTYNVHPQQLDNHT